MSTDDQELKRILSINNNRLNRDVALRTVAAGMPVFPVKAEKIANQRYSFVPLFASAPRSATKHLGIIEGWWSHTIRAIPAIPCADIVVIRTHRFYSGFDGVAAFEALIGDQEWPSPPVVLTPDGGKEYYFLQPQSRLDYHTGGLPEGVNVRGLGNFVIAPGAETLDGARWQVDDSVPPNDIPELPAWLERIIRSPAD